MQISRSVLYLNFQMFSISKFLFNFAQLKLYINVDRIH